MRSSSSSETLSTSFLSTTSPLKTSFALKIMHLKDSRFESASLIFNIKDLESNIDNHRKAAKKHSCFSLSSLSRDSYYHPPHPKDDSSSSNLNKDILGTYNSTKLLSSKIISRKTLGTYETYSFSYLGTSTCSKSNVIAENISSISVHLHSRHHSLHVPFPLLH